MCIMFFLLWRHHEPSGLHLWENSSTCKRILSTSRHPWTATYCQSKIGNLWKVSFVECPWWIFLFWSDVIWIFHHTRLNQGVIFWVWIRDGSCPFSALGLCFGLWDFTQVGSWVNEFWFGFIKLCSGQAWVKFFLIFWLNLDTFMEKNIFGLA